MKYLRFFSLLAVIGLLAGLVFGCGYRFAERSESLPSWIQSVYVAPFVNKSNEFQLASWITEDLRREFLRGGALRLAERDDADVIIEGEVRRVDVSGLSFLTYDKAVERRINVECAVRMKDRRTGRILWQTANLVRDEGFLTGRDNMESDALKADASRKLSRYMAELIYHRVTGVF